MASATVESTALADAAADDCSEPTLGFEALPLIDLRLLTQSELYSLSVSSSAPSPSSQDDSVVPIPKIDRSVFNESAGSRKQTYFRLRLAPRNSSSNLTPISRQKSPEPPSEENTRIISLLENLFAPHGADEPLDADLEPIPDDDKSNLIAVEVEYDACVPESSSSVLQAVPIDVVDKPEVMIVETPVFKRKRGRPRKYENSSGSLPTVVKQVVVVSETDKVQVKEEKQLEEKLKVVDFDQIEEELKKRTKGLRTEGELSEFMSGLSGEWGGRRKKRKIVNASSFGDVLPAGWKILLSIKNDGDRVWLGCSCYISPDGQQFESCKDVSPHPHSPFGKEASESNSVPADDDSQLACKMTPRNFADSPPEMDQNHHEIGCTSALPSSSVMVDDQKQEPLLLSGGQEKFQMGCFKCHKCTMTFDEKDNLLLHLLTPHKKSRSGATRGCPPNPEAVIMRDGMYECQLCHKLFEEKNRFNGHFGNHIKAYVKRVEGSAATTRRRKKMSNLQEPFPIDRVCTVETYNTKADGEHNRGFLDTTSNIHDILTTDPADFPRNKAKLMVRNAEHVCDDIEKQQMISGLPNEALEVVDETSSIASGFNVPKDAPEVKSRDDNIVGTSETPDQPTVLGMDNNKVSMHFVSSLENLTQETDLKHDVAAMNEKNHAINNENLVSSLFDSSMEEIELDDGVEVGNDLLISEIGDPCFVLEEGAVNDDKQQTSHEGSFVQIGDKERSMNHNVTESQTSALRVSKKETGSEIYLSNQQIVRPDTEAAVGGTVDEHMSYSSWHGGKTVPSRKDVKNSVQESGTRFPVVQSLEKHARVNEENESGRSISKVENLWHQKVLESSSVSAPLKTSDLGGNEDGRFIFNVQTMWQQNQKVLESSSLSASLRKISSKECENGMTRSVIPSLNHHMQNIEEQQKGHSTSKVGHPWQQKVPESSSLSAPLKTSHLDTRLMNVSSGVMEPFKVNHDTRQHSSVSNYGKNERNSEAALPFASQHQQTFPNINTEPSVNAMEVPKDFRSLRGQSAGYQDYDKNIRNVTSFRAREKQKHEEAASTWNNANSFAFDSRYSLHDGNAAMGFVQDRSAEASPHLFARSTQVVAPDHRGNVVFGGTVEEPKGNKEPMFGLYSPGVVDQQTPGINYNMNMFYSGTMPGDRRVGNAGPTGNSEQMMGFYKPRQEVVSQPTWRTEENTLQSGLNYVSPPMAQRQPDCYSSFNMVSDNKVQSRYYGSSNQKVGNTQTGTAGGVRSGGGGEYLEYNFLPVPSATSHSGGGSKVTSSVDQQMQQQQQQNYDSNWLEKDTLGLFPKMRSGTSASNSSNRHQVTALCVWCGNQFNTDGDFDAESGSVGYMCFNCKAKFAGQINFL